MLKLIGETGADEPLFDVSHIITEDDEPVDNLFSAKQQRLAVQSLYANDVLARPFLADANVGVFHDPYIPPVVPDVFLSLGVKPAKNIHEKRHRTYFVWEFGKPPDVAVEVVSNKKGGELHKQAKYAQIGVQYYIIFDPQRRILGDDLLRVYELIDGEYHLKADWILDDIGIGVTLWDGVFEELDDKWLRWFVPDGEILRTDAENKEIERKNAERERENAERERENARVEHERAERERERADRLAEQLRQLGIDPDQL